MFTHLPEHYFAFLRVLQEKIETNSCFDCCVVASLLLVMLLCLLLSSMNSGILLSTLAVAVTLFQEKRLRSCPHNIFLFFPSPMRGCSGRNSFRDQSISFIFFSQGNVQSLETKMWGLKVGLDLSYKSPKWSRIAARCWLCQMREIYPAPRSTQAYFRFRREDISLWCHMPQPAAFFPPWSIAHCFVDRSVPFGYGTDACYFLRPYTHDFCNNSRRALCSRTWFFLREILFWRQIYRRPCNVREQV